MLFIYSTIQPIQVKMATPVWSFSIDTQQICKIHPARAAKRLFFKKNNKTILNIPVEAFILWYSANEEQLTRAVISYRLTLLKLFSSLSGLQWRSFHIVFMYSEPNCKVYLAPNGLLLIRNNKAEEWNGSIGQQMVIGCRWRRNDGDVWRSFTVAL